MVPGAGIEPARPEGREILNLLCLPIPPSGPILLPKGAYQSDDHKIETVEARAGVEPAYVDLQSSA